MRIDEKSLILPALYIIKRDGGSSTSELIKELTFFFNPSGEDAEILKGRPDTKFSQKVRNLKSHRETNGMKGFTDIHAGKYVLTAKGESFLQPHFDKLEYLFSNRFAEEDIVPVVAAIENSIGKKKTIIVYCEEDMVSEGKAVPKETTMKKRSRKLRSAAIERYRNSDGKIRCDVCGFCFEEIYGDVGKDFIEVHHETPIYQYSDDGFETYIGVAVEKMKPLCANCHRMIHHNSRRPLTIAELKTILAQRKTVH